jgi:prefoldin subunit 5
MDVIQGKKELLGCFASVAPFFSFITEEDLGIFVYDRKQLLVYNPSKKINLGLRAGDPVREGTMPDKCMKSGQRMVTLITAEKSRTGIPYVSVATPIKDGTEVIGCVITNQTLDVYYKIMEAANNLNNSCHTLFDSMAKVNDHSKELEAGAKTLKELEHTLQENIKSSAEMVTFVQNLARQTNLLGVNAAIEAARAGQYGKGFSVVANEIRNMANNSSQSVDSITENLNGIRKEISRLSDFSQNMEGSITNQTTCIQEIQKASDVLHEVTEELVEISKSMFGITEIV